MRASPAQLRSCLPGTTAAFLLLVLFAFLARASADAELRRARSPLEVASQLSRNYGHEFPNVSYQQALALVGRARLANLTGDEAETRDVRQLAEAVPDGKKLRGSTVAGYLIFAELGMTERLIYAAAEAPDHNEMSDGVFMGCPLLAAAGKPDACLEHLRDVQRLCLRDDGIYRHSPLHEAAWGRGNGFPALGLAWTLDYLPEDFFGRGEVLTSFRNHLAALSSHQAENGMWHQVIDHPDSYAELSGTCMITYAMIHGLRHGWLDPATYEPIVDLAWEAIKLRIALDGEHLTDVCEGTGKQSSLEAYFQRRAIQGRDERGGAMALLVATERALWEGERSSVPAQE